jgi:phosphate transport system substrate-binding protein
MHKQPKDAERAKQALEFFGWALENGQAQAQSLDYVALPPELVTQVKQYWATNLKY